MTGVGAAFSGCPEVPRMRLHWRGAVAASLLAVALASEARVFQRVGGGPVFRADRAGRSAYATTMRLNGGETAVAVTALDGGVASVGRALAAAAPPGATGRFATNGDAGVGRIESQDGTVAVLAVAPGREDRVLAVSVEQTRQERERSRQPARAAGATGIPPLPGSVLTCTMRNDDTLTALETRRTAIAPSAAAAYYDAALRGGGWDRLMPSDTSGRGLLVYVKDADVCWVQIGATDSRGDCLVTIVRKPGAAK